MDEVTLLSREQIFEDNKLDIFKKIDASATITDFAILLGGFCSIKRTGYYWIKMNYNIVDSSGYKDHEHTNHRSNGIRPVLSYAKIKDDISNEIKYGEYP